MHANKGNPCRWLDALLRALSEIDLSYWAPIYYRGKKYGAAGYELADGTLLARIVADRCQAFSYGRPVRLMTFRAEFRRIAGRPRVAGLIPCLNGPHPELVRLTIWLMGRKHAKYAIPLIAPYSQSINVRVRRETARALRRLEAWSELRTMAEFDSDERVCCLATPAPAKPFDQRMARFAGDTREEQPAARRSRAMTFIERVPMGPGKIPKTPEFIRALLERIHRLVHG